MFHPIVSKSTPITLLGGGEVTSDTLSEALTRAPILVACDGGAKFALENNVQPVAVIGDMDSIDAVSREKIGAERLFLVTEQDTTDFEKALLRCEAPIMLGVGFTGARLDHELAAFNALVHHDSKTVILLGGEDVVFRAPKSLRIDLPIGSRFSLFPMGHVRGTSEGLRWPINGLEFEPCGRIGTSNEVSGPVTLTFDAPHMLVILPRSALKVAMDALYSAA
ncbi:thiamine diphosphokinase [Falsihalocynthiibacter sp. S25ZX9]|uniref:thiamine diphosphokinase n=1 Tax=Falsihalocynthiibacter sp. S25ZX9 TaxID=3240870 RepID=UPI0035106793